MKYVFIYTYKIYIRCSGYKVFKIIIYWKNLGYFEIDIIVWLFFPKPLLCQFFFKTALSSSTIWRIVKRHKFVPAMCIFVPKENYWELFTSSSKVKGFWSDLLLANYQVYYDPTLNNAQLPSVSWFLPVLHTFSIEKKLCETGLCPGEIMNLISKDYIIIHD